jgi:ATP-binding cassette subfamily B (MDR/TAP) protein 1
MSGLTPDIEEVHKSACAQGEATYLDPSTQYTVFTRDSLRKRGKCCGNGCRHCPFGHFNVSSEFRSTLAHESIGATLLRKRGRKLGRKQKLIALFFSGGKNSFLSYHKLKEAYDDDSEYDIVLFTLFQQEDEMLPYQGVSIQQAMQAAKEMNVDLFIAPQKDYTNDGYVSSVLDGLDELKLNAAADQSNIEVTLAFGDVSNEACRSWRETTFANNFENLLFPIWNMTTPQIFEALGRHHEFKCKVIRNSCDKAKIGLEWTTEFVTELQKAVEGASPIGENGEFDTIMLKHCK